MILYDQIADQISVSFLMSFSIIYIQFSVESLYLILKRVAQFKISNLNINFAKQINRQQVHATFATRIPLKSETQKESFTKFKLSSGNAQRNTQNSYQPKLANRPAKTFNYRKRFLYDMAQSASESRKTPLPIEPLRGRVTSEPQIRWENWRIQVKIAMLARENILLDTLLQAMPTHVRISAEPKYEITIEDAIEPTERDRQIRNSQLKLQWEWKCQKITEAGVLCGERPWSLCDQKCISLVYFSIGTEGRRLLTQEFPHDNISDVSNLKLLEMMKIAFIRPRNITFDRYVFFLRKQKEGETVEQYYIS